MINDAKQIWITGENGVNTWMCFRKEFECTSTGEDAPVIAEIAVDSKYWLYLNGKLLVREGGLKRGPSRNGTYYDEVDLSEYLIPGRNTLAILVWHFGKSGFSHLSSNLGGLRCAIALPDGVLFSDASWQVKKHPAFVAPDPADEPTNFRLAEANIYFDAAKDVEGWQEVDYDSSTWQCADEIPEELAGQAWGRLEKRIIPQLKDFGVKQYLGGETYENITLEEDTVVALRLPYNAQFTPRLSISAPEGLKIVIKTDNYEVGMMGEKCAMSVYYTKGGAQSYEALGWLNGEWAYYHFPAGVTIHSLGYRETGYNTEFVGNFACDDEFLNKLWEKSLRTLYVTMRDTFMDCPDRERVQWWGDVNIEMQMALYCLDEKALLLYKKGVDSLVGWSENGAHMMTVVPSGTEQFELPFQNLAGIWGFWYYYEYTGDKSVPEKAYEMSKEYLKLYSMGEDGLVVHRSGSWDWPDWGEHADEAVMENAWYYMALQSARNMAELLGKIEDIPFYEERLQSIAENYDRMYWKGECYYHFTDNGLADDRANALAVLSGLAKQKHYPGILAVLESTENSSPYMEKYVLDAMCEMGYIDEAILRMKRRYKEMVEEDYSTLWEYWNKDGTKNHAWSGGPLITMAKYIAGIRPAAVGYEKILIKPHLGHLKHIKCCVPSVRGEIVVEV
ncbi:MAG: hypothetical protein IJZ82_09840 [Lachnospiraceae bacterium]|nr:hypothetical protein [Lachnospiraceae bacterium]